MSARDRIREITLSLATAGRLVEPSEVTAALDDFKAEVLSAFVEKVAKDLGGCCAECDACIEIMRHHAEAERCTTFQGDGDLCTACGDARRWHRPTT